jgi:serine/threonine-protein kinase
MSAQIKANLHLEIAHILFLDVVGYSKLLINEQSELVQKLNEIVLQTEQVRAADAANQLIRLATGDGLALVFRNHPEAPAECALEIAAAVKGHPEIQVRMGVHSGPVNEITDVNQRANIAGAGMNMAQRVMDCGDAGHILLSKRVADDLAQHREWQSRLHDLGEVEVKHGLMISLVNLYTADLGNPAAPEKIRRAKREQILATRRRRIALATLALFAALALGAIQWWSLDRTKLGSAPAVTSTSAVAVSIPAKSIAVLPLDNLSEDKEDAFFADGIQDDVLTSLAKIKDLKVISLTSVMSYRKAARNLREIGKELGVAHVLEGSVRRVANRVLVNVQLIDTASDQHIWAERYDRTLADSITLQGELATEIARALRATLSPEEKARVETKATDNPEAYVFYLRGREAQLRPEMSREIYLTAESFYKQALALDPRFVLARAQLSFMQASLYHNFERTNAARLAEARANAEEALRLDANSAEAHLTLAKCAYLVQDEATARRELTAAVQLHPNDAMTAMDAASIQMTCGWDEEAAANYKRAAELGPREPKIFLNYGWLLQTTGQEAEARAALDRALVLAPESVSNRLYRAEAELSWSGDIGRAKAILAGLPAGQDPDGRVTSAYCNIAILERNFPEALRLLQAYPSETLPWAGDVGGIGRPEPKAFSEGTIHLYAGDRARAYECCESARWMYEVDVRDKPRSADGHVNLAYVYAWMGWKEPAMAEVARAIELETSAGVPPKRRGSLSLAQVYTWAAEPDLALRQIEQFLAFGPKSYTIHNFRLDPVWDPLRNDPRFQKLLETKKL